MTADESCSGNVYRSSLISLVRATYIGGATGLSLRHGSSFSAIVY